MRLKVLLPAGLLILAVCVVAMVRAQDGGNRSASNIWSGMSERPAGAAEREPSIFTAAAAQELAADRAVGGDAAPAAASQAIHRTAAATTRPSGANFDPAVRPASGPGGLLGQMLPQRPAADPAPANPQTDDIYLSRGLRMHQRLQAIRQSAGTPLPVDAPTAAAPLVIEEGVEVAPPASLRHEGTPGIAAPRALAPGGATPGTAAALPSLPSGAPTGSGFRGTPSTDGTQSILNRQGASPAPLTHDGAAPRMMGQPAPAASLPDDADDEPALDPIGGGESILRRQPAAIAGPRSAPEVPDAAASSPAAPALPVDSQGRAVLLSGKGPALAVQTQGPRTVVIGKESAYQVTIANTGDTVANEVVVLVRIPPGAEIVDNAATRGAAVFETVAAGDGRVRWTIETLDGGQSENLNLRIIPRNSRSFDLGVTWNYTPTASQAQIEVLEPRLEMSLTGPRDLLYGDTKVFTLTLSNPGTGDAENVVVNLLPLSPGQDEAASTKIGTVRAREQKQIELELTARHAGTLSIRAQAFGDGDLRAEAGQDVLVRRGELHVQTSGPTVKYAGTVASYSLRVSNTGNAAAENVVVEAALPQGATLVSASDGGGRQEATGRVRWVVGGLHPGADRTLELSCVLGQAGDNHLELFARADGDLSAGRSFTTKVEALADLKLQVNDPRGPAPVGEDVVYEVRLHNRGTKAAEEVHVVVYFSNGIEPQAVEGARSRIEPGQVVFEPIARIEAGQELVLKITARADQPGSHICRTEVECRDPVTRLANEETTRFYNRAGEGAVVEQPWPGDAGRQSYRPRPAEGATYEPRMR